MALQLYFWGNLEKSMTDQKTKAEQFRALHVPGKPLVLFNIWDAGSTKAVASAGAKAIATGSWSIAHANGFEDGERTPLVLAIENLRRIVAANTHGLTVRLAGTFTPTDEQLALAEEMQALGIELFERARATGLLRDDVTYLDVEFLLEFLAGVKLGGAGRTAELRQRHLAVVIDGLRAGGRTPLPGRPPTWEEQTQRWLPR